MPTRLLADENIDARIIEALSVRGFEVASVRTDFKGRSDREILDLAKSRQALLLTEDKDFGEWVFAFKEKGVGVIFLRYDPRHREAIINSLVAVLEGYGPKLLGRFVVLTAKKMRMR